MDSQVNRPRLTLVAPERPLAKLSYAEKLARAKAYLQRRGRYILDRGTPRPNWGRPHDVPAVDSALMDKLIDADRRRKK